MKRRIYAAVLSVLLAVSLMLSLPVTAKADSWEDTIAQYDRLFAATDEEPAATGDAAAEEETLIDEKEVIEGKYKEL